MASISEGVKKALTMGWGKNLGDKVSQARRAILLGHPDRSSCHSLTHPVVCNSVMLLFESRVRQGDIVSDCFIITKYITWSKYRDTKHAQLIL